MDVPGFGQITVDTCSTFPTTERVMLKYTNTTASDQDTYAVTVSSEVLSSPSPGAFADDAFVLQREVPGRVNENWLVDLDDARTKIEVWRIDYNTVRLQSAREPHPAEYAAIRKISRTKRYSLFVPTSHPPVAFIDVFAPRACYQPAALP
jgi:hypothetical protein